MKESGKYDENDLSTLKSMRRAFHMTKQRCYNESCADYKYYGGRGIKVCSRWLESFDAFVSDMGIRPKGMTLERIDNDKDYSPENCIWASRSIQSQNTRQSKIISYNGESHTMSEWERLLGFKEGTLKARLGPLGYSVDEAMTKPVKCGGLLPNKHYAHLEDQSWRDTKSMHKNPKLPKLSEDNVNHMRLLYNAVAMTFTSLGILFGVSTETASSAVQSLAAYEVYPC
jgi:hypothetical protein